MVFVADFANLKTVERLVGELEKSAAFSGWRKSNRDAYLSSVFAMAAGSGEFGEPGNEWLISYYDRKDDTFTTFSSLGTQKGAREQAFKKGRTLPELKLASVKVEADGAISAAEKVRIENYKGEEVSRIILVLQPLLPGEISGAAQKAKGGAAEVVWNTTYVTTSYNVLNVKISAETGKVLKHSLSGIMDFMQKD